LTQRPRCPGRSDEGSRTLSRTSQPLPPSTLPARRGDEALATLRGDDAAAKELAAELPAQNAGNAAGLTTPEVLRLRRGVLAGLVDE